MEFTHLHNHSYYSLMDGYNSPEELFQAAKDWGQTAMAITDHGTLSSHRETQEAAQKTGIKPILGLEAYISPTDRFDRRSVKKREDNTQLYNHIILLAKDQAGVENLNRMSEKAWTEGYYYKPRIDLDLLEELGSGIIVLSGCLNGLIAKAIEREELDVAEKITERLAQRFGSDFYMEVQPHNPLETNQQLLRIADMYAVEPVVTTDCHFAKSEQRAVEEALLILSTSPKYDKEKNYENTKSINDIFERYNALYPERPISFADLDVYVMDRKDIHAQMKEQGFERDDIYDNTVAITEKVGEYDYHKGLDLLPEVSDNPDATLRERVLVGLEDKGLASEEKYVKRVEKELEIIHNKNFSPYFIIVEDMVRWARDNGIFVGPGRGSAAGSLVCYVLGITEVDPIEFDLLFARFINEERNDYPDIDVDFEIKHRKRVKEYLQKKYGYAASISNFNYFSEKGVIRDAARVFRVPVGDVNKALKAVHFFDDFKTSPNTAEFRSKYPEVLPLAEALRGRIRNVGIHAAGVIVSKEPIEKYAPIETRDDKEDKVSGRLPVVALDMEQVADIGFIKLDALGLKNLDVINDTLRSIRKRGKEVPNLTALPLDDRKVFQAFNEGYTAGVFQADTSTYRSLLMEMGVDNFEDLAASNALVRPGARDTVGDSFIKRKHGKEAVHYVHEIMRPYLEPTYGTIIYQEQVMLAAVYLGGFSWSEADSLRKIIGKKKDKREFEKWYDKWMEGATKHIGEKEADDLWHDFEAHAGYSFNRSHAVAYSKISYWTMWLKLNYPIEYMTALLRNEDKKEKIVEYFIELKRMGISLRLPHVNKSGRNFTIEGDAVRIGLLNIKGIGEAAADALVEHRPFKNYAHLLDIKDEKGTGIGSTVIGSLNAVGASTFPDHPRPDSIVDNYYEYLNIPKFDSYDFPSEVTDALTPVEDFDEEGSFVIKAMVTKIKRGKGWSKIDMIDETGACSAFHDEDTPIESGQQYFFVVSSNRVYKWLSVKDVWDQLSESSVDPLVAFLRGDELGTSPGGGVYIIAAHKRFTKARKMMANVVVATHDRELRGVLVFPKQFGKLNSHLKEGEVRKFTVKRLDDGGFMLLEAKKE